MTRFSAPDKGVNTAEEAVTGAQDILAEDISDNAEIRKLFRRHTYRTGKICTKAVDSEKPSVYEMYYDFSEPVNRITGHRILAIERGEREGFLKVSVEIDTVEAIGMLRQRYVKGTGSCSDAVADTCADCFSRLLYPAIERDIRSTLFDDAAAGAIRLFSANLRQLLLQPPVKNAVTLGFDPAYESQMAAISLTIPAFIPSPIKLQKNCFPFAATQLRT